MSIFKKIKDTLKNRKTYRAGLLQAKVYRIFKGYTQDKLSAFNISTIDWALIGLLYDSADGMRPSMLAEQLGVEAPFVTVLLANLKKLGFVDMKSDGKDNRVKIVTLTQKGEGMVPEIEKTLRHEMRALVKGISPDDLISYLSVLEQIHDNSKTLSIKKFPGFKDL